MEPQKEYTQEDVDRLIQQREDIDEEIDKAQSYIWQKTMGYLEDEYRKSLVGKFLVTKRDWDIGDCTVRYISDIKVIKDFRGNKELNLSVQSFIVDSKKEMPDASSETLVMRFEDIPTLDEESSSGYVLCDADSLLKPSGKYRKHLDACLKKHWTEIQIRTTAKMKAYFADIKKFHKTFNKEQEEKNAETEVPIEVQDFIELCKKYIPECIVKDEGTCGWICFKGGTEPYDAIVALLPRAGEYAVYDQWRDCTITKDKEYMLDFLKSKATVKIQGDDQ